MAETSYPDALPAQYRLHWYVLERVLGQGGFGITYVARDTNLDQLVAIKEYLPVDVATRRADATVRARTDDQGERYRWGLDRFIREARTLARFDHPNIVRVLSVFEHNDTAYMVMRFEEGENLAALLERRRTLPEAELLRVLLPIVDGLALVHSAGFIHRDIKPDNIHIRTDGSPVLLDFGSARLALGHARTVTILVAPGYAPFEQYYSTGENQGPWTDIYGLGATAYRAIAGIAPMDAIARSKGKLGSTQEILVPATAMGKGRYSERLLQAIDHALEFSEKDRPQSLAEWRRELTGDTESAAATTAAVPASRPAQGPVQTSLPAAPAAAAAAAAAPATRGVIIGSVVGAVVAVTAVVLYLQPGAEREKLARELERSEQVRRELQEQQDALKRREAEAQRKLEDNERRMREAPPKSEPELKPAAAPAEPAKKEPQAKVAKAPAEASRPRQAPAQPAAQQPQPRPAPPKSAPQKTEPRPAATAASEAKSEPPRAQAVPTPPPEAPKPVASTQPAAPKVEPVPKPAPAPAAASDKAGAAVPPEKPDTRALALKGDAAAQFRLGEMYETGRDVTQNYFQAYYWYSAALRGGHAAARGKKDQMAARLQPAEVQQADRLVERLVRPAK